MNPKLPQYTIYCATCKVNGKSYIGKTSQAIWTRWAAHLRIANEIKRYDFSKSACEISSDLALYGDDAFELIVLEVCESKEVMDQREIWWIMERKTAAPFGYNRHMGDYVNHSASTKEKFSNRKCASRRGVLAVKDSQAIHFKSMRDFCKHLGVHRCTVERTIKRGLSAINGYTFKIQDNK